jgi:hypothetical protein
MKSTGYWEITLCSLVEIHLWFGSTHYFHLHIRSASQENSQQESGDMQSFGGAICSSETSVNFYPTTHRHIPKDNSGNILSSVKFRTSTISPRILKRIFSVYFRVYEMTDLLYVSFILYMSSLTPGPARYIHLFETATWVIWNLQ